MVAGWSALPIKRTAKRKLVKHSTSQGPWLPALAVESRNRSFVINADDFVFECPLRNGNLHPITRFFAE